MSNQAISFLTIGRTGVGKSTFLNFLAERQIFPVSGKAHSCTKEVNCQSIQKKDLTMYLIDCPGLEDSDGNDQANMEQLQLFLTNHQPGLNLIALFLPVGNYRFDSNLQKYIKFLYKFFDHANFWDHFCVIVTNSPDTEEELDELKTDMTDGPDSLHSLIITMIKQICNMDVDPDIPFFYFNSKYPDRLPNQKDLPKFLELVKSCSTPFPTQNLKKPDVIYQYSEEWTEKKDVCGPQLPIYQIIPGNPIMQEIEKQEPYEDEEEKEVEIDQEYEVYVSRPVDTIDFMTLGISRLFRDNKIKETRTRKVKVRRKEKVIKYKTIKTKEYSGKVEENQTILVGYFQQNTQYEKKYTVYWTYDCKSDDINNRRNPSGYGPVEETELGKNYIFFDDKKQVLDEKTNSHQIQQLRKLMNLDTSS